jgi:ParB family transcriptional regulator, chromosome partitioning protein
MKSKINPFLASVSGLGSGVNTLFKDDKDEYLLLPVEDIVIEEQVRKQMEDEDNTSEEMAASVKETNGIIQPITVMLENNQYILLTGERRYRGTVDAGLENIPAILKKNVTRKDVKAWRLIENIQRKELTLMELAEGLRDYLDSEKEKHIASTGKKSGATEAALKKLKQNKHWLSKMLALLKLPENAEAARLASTNLTTDLSAIHAIKRIEEVSPSEAKGIVDRVIEGKGKVNLRKAIDEVKAVVLSSPMPKPSAKPKPVETPDDVHLSEDDKIRVDNCFETIYEDMQSGVKRSVKPLLSNFSNEETQLIKAHLNMFYGFGLSEKKPTKFMLDGLKSKKFSYVDFRAFYLSAFMMGVKGNDFNMVDIMNDIF